MSKQTKARTGEVATWAVWDVERKELTECPSRAYARELARESRETFGSEFRIARVVLDK